jgi:hypothetical protein
LDLIEELEYLARAEVVRRMGRVLIVVFVIAVVAIVAYLLLSRRRR